MPAAPKQKSVNHGGKRSEYQDKEKPTQIRFSNINAAKGLFTSIFLWFWGVNSHVFNKIEKTWIWHSIIYGLKENNAILNPGVHYLY